MHSKLFLNTDYAVNIRLEHRYVNLLVEANFGFCHGSSSAHPFRLKFKF